MIKLGDNNISDIKLGSTNVKSVYQGDTLIWPPIILVYTTTSANQSVQLTYHKEYFAYIETEDGVEDLSGSGILNHTFVNAGEHKVKVLFKKGLTDFSDCFLNCAELTSIPSNLFTNNPEAGNFGSCFHSCTGLTSIPKGLFANNTEVYNFSACFSYCKGLTSVPEGLFANSRGVTDFGSCFENCTGLISIPNNLFANNVRVRSFNACFLGCTGLTSSTPIDNDGTPLYNRSSETASGGKEGYVVVTLYGWCFGGCTLMSDYSSIPDDWK